MKTLLQSVLINCGKACLTDSNTNAAIGNIAKVMGSELCVVKPLYKKSCVECWAFLSNVTAFIDQWFSRTHQLVLKKKNQTSCLSASRVVWCHSSSSLLLLMLLSDGLTHLHHPFHPPHLHQAAVSQTWVHAVAFNSSSSSRFLLLLLLWTLSPESNHKSVNLNIP